MAATVKTVERIEILEAQVRDLLTKLANQSLLVDELVTQIESAKSAPATELRDQAQQDVRAFRFPQETLDRKANLSKIYNDMRAVRATTADGRVIQPFSYALTQEMHKLLLTVTRDSKPTMRQDQLDWLTKQAAKFPQVQVWLENYTQACTIRKVGLTLNSQVEQDDNDLAQVLEAEAVPA
jgi:hypothetical protein